jgi:hypothetical protein
MRIGVKEVLAQRVNQEWGAGERKAWIFDCRSMILSLLATGLDAAILSMGT